MKKEIKRKRVNSSTPKKTTRSSRYETKSIKKRVTEKKKLKTKNTILLALLLICIVITIFVYLKVGAIGAIGIGGFLAITLGIIVLLVKLKSRGKKVVITVLLMLILAGGIAAMSAFGIFIFYIKSISDPLYADKESELNKKETTTLYDGAGYEFAKLGSEMREKVSYEELPEVLIDAIVATEDSRFFQHNGFDAPRFIKASLGQVVGNRNAGGASTLSM